MPPHLPLKPFFVTTPIFYVNAAPHLGHLYTVLMADAQARFQRLRTPERKTLLTSGSDEHGQKIARAADLHKETPSAFTERISRTFSHAFERCDAGVDDFVRTSQPRHVLAVQELWRRLADRGHLSQARYAGWYCVPDESFVTEAQLTERPDQPGVKVSAESGHPVEWAEEDNYVFPLKQFVPEVRKWLDGPDVLRPAQFRPQLNALFEHAPEQLSVSRPRQRVPWGVPVPDDDAHTVYVWLDALANYLTAAKTSGESNVWPPDVQLVGKDILKFHALYWPAFLLAAGLDLPRQIFCHGHWLVDDQKMSKSKGNVVAAHDLLDRFGGDGVRYVLLREGVPHADSNYSEQKMVNYLNSELANTLGNLLNRCTAKSVNRDQTFVALGTEEWLDKYRSKESQELLELLDTLADRVEACYAEFNYYQGIDRIMEVLRQTNLFFHEEKPWELRKSDCSVENREERLDFVLHLAMESLRVSGILLQPIVPALSGKLLDKLSVQDRLLSDAKLLSWSGRPQKYTPLSGDKVVLFNKLKA